MVAGRSAGRHRDYFLALAEEAEPKLRSAEPSGCALEDEHENLRASLEWSLAADPRRLRLCGALSGSGSAWTFRRGPGVVRTGPGEHAGHERTRERALALSAAGNTASVRADFPRGPGAFRRESLTIRRELGDRRGVAQSLNGLGNIACDQGDCASSEPMPKRVWQSTRSSGSRVKSPRNWATWAWKDLQGDVDAARALYGESLAICREQGDRVGMALMLNNLGVIASDLASARALQDESLAIRRELGDRMGIADSLSNLTSLALDQGDFAAARVSARKAS